MRTRRSTLMLAGAGCFMVAAALTYFTRDVWVGWIRANDNHIANSGNETDGINGGTKSGDNHGDAKGATELTLAPEAIERYSIKTEEAKLTVLSPTFVAPGEISFDTERMSHVSSAVTGRVAELKVRVGDQVKKGDDLIVIDSPELGAAQSDHLQKRISVEVATPAVALARSGYERAKRVFEDKQGLTLTELQKREGEFKSAEGNLQLAESALAASIDRLRLLGMNDDAIEKLDYGHKIDSKFVIRSPLGGQVVERTVTLGELVRPEKESLLTVADLTTVWVLADVPEFRLKGLRVGGAARIKAGEGTTPFEGTVSFLPPQLDSFTRTARVRIDVKNDRGLLRAGTFTQVEIAEGKSEPDAKAVVAIPEEAVQNIDGNPSIFVPVEGKEHTFARKTIVVGPTAGGMVTVEAGLKEGQPFVSSGTFILKAELGKSSIED